MYCRPNSIVPPQPPQPPLPPFLRTALGPQVFAASLRRRRAAISALPQLVAAARSSTVLRIDRERVLVERTRELRAIQFVLNPVLAMFDRTGMDPAPQSGPARGSLSETTGQIGTRQWHVIGAAAASERVVHSNGSRREARVAGSAQVTRFVTRVAAPARVEHAGPTVIRSVVSQPSNGPASSVREGVTDSSERLGAQSEAAPREGEKPTLLASTRAVEVLADAVLQKIDGRLQSQRERREKWP